jgi:hypothetical protein
MGREGAMKSVKYEVGGVSSTVYRTTFRLIILGFIKYVKKCIEHSVIHKPLTYTQGKWTR